MPRLDCRRKAAFRRLSEQSKQMRGHENCHFVSPNGLLATSWPEAAVASSGLKSLEAVQHDIELDISREVIGESGVLGIGVASEPVG